MCMASQEENNEWVLKWMGSENYEGIGYDLDLLMVIILHLYPPLKLHMLEVKKQP